MSQKFLEKLQPGFVGWCNNSNEEYHAGKGVGSTQIKDYLANPGVFYHRHVMGFPRKETKSLKLGRLVHEAILEPNKFLLRYIVMPDFGDLRSSKNRAERDKWLENTPAGSVVVTEEERQKIIDIADSIMAHPYASRFLTDGVAEQSGYWRDEKTGLYMKLRPDFRQNDGTIIDLKTCRSTKYRIFQKDAFGYGYQISAAHYLTGASEIENKKFDDFIFIAVESESPYAVEVMVADEEFLDYGRKQFRAGLDALAESVKLHAKNMDAKGQARNLIWPCTTAPSRRLEIMNLTLPEYAHWE